MSKGSGYMLVNIKAAKAKRSLQDFMAENQLRGKELSLEELEDLGLLVMMLEADQTKKVSRDTIMRKLRR